MSNTVIVNEVRIENPEERPLLGAHQLAPDDVYEVIGANGKVLGTAIVRGGVIFYFHFESPFGGQNTIGYDFTYASDYYLRALPVGAKASIELEVMDRGNSQKGFSEEASLAN